MMSFLPAPVCGTLVLLGYTFNTIFWFIPIVLLAFFKLLIPSMRWRRSMSPVLDVFASAWIGVNTLIEKLFLGTQIEVFNEATLDRKERYLVIANHQSWVDILILQRVFHRKIPFLKFFLKKELIYVPFLGIAWWALDFPFMHRHTKAEIKKKPHLAGKDIDTTRKACERFRHAPVSIMNFVEGTRFTEEKHQRQKSPYKHLLKPKAGGVAFVLSSIGDQLHSVLDISISYQNNNAPTMWNFACGRLESCKVHIRALPIEQELTTDYSQSSGHRVIFQRKINEIWEEKDARLEQLAQE